MSNVIKNNNFELEKEREKYRNIIYLIAEKIENKKEQEYIEDNIETIVNNIIELAKYIDSISKIILGNDTYENKILKVQKLRSEKIEKVQAKQLVDKFLLKDLKGGEIEKSVKENDKFKKLNDVNNLCLSNLPQLMFKIFIESPGFLLSLPKYIIKSFFNLFGLECCEPTDYMKPLGFTYLILFFIASFPFIGAISDFIIIIKSLQDGRFFLATLTLISRFISQILTMSFVDLGLLFKVFYSMDTLSVRKYSKQSPDIMKEEEEELKRIEQERNELLVKQKIESIKLKENIQEDKQENKDKQKGGKEKGRKEKEKKIRTIINSFEEEIGMLFQ